MAEIPRSLLDEYTEKLNVISKYGQMLIQNSLANCQWEDVADLRNQLIEIFNQVHQTIGDMVQEAAAKFFDDVRELSIGERLEEFPEVAYNYNANESAVRAFVNNVSKENGLSTLNANLKSRVGWLSKRIAYDSVESLARKDPRKPKWARVPSGFETCVFCIKLASLGFAYHSRENASHSHDRCRCIIVPGYNDTKYEGYDPEVYYRVWKRIEDAEVIANDLYNGGKNTVMRQIEEIQKGFNNHWEEYLRVGRRQSSVFQNTIGKYLKSISQNNNMFVEDFTRVEAKELFVGCLLSRFFEEVQFRNPGIAKKKNERTSDLQLDNHLYDIKTIKSSNPSKIAKRISEKADNQGPRYIVDLSCSNISKKDAAIKIAWLLEDPRIEEILLIINGSLIRYK